ncbi:hypothetical protein [Phenylobacterium aquaticum]|nr:hypothetical protein [Phenylobacterium aquaticum]
MSNLSHVSPRFNASRLGGLASLLMAALPMVALAMIAFAGGLA